MHSINICFKYGCNIFSVSYASKTVCKPFVYALTCSMLGKKFNRRHFEIALIVHAKGDNLHKPAKLIFCKIEYK